MANSDAETEYAVEEVDGTELKIATLNGPNGSFEVALAGGFPDGYNFFYRDKEFQFFFQGVMDLGNGTAQIESTSQRLRNGAAIKTRSLSPGNSMVLKQNIEFFLTTRSYIMPWRHLKGPVTTVIFSNNIGI